MRQTRTEQNGNKKQKKKRRAVFRLFTFLFIIFLTASSAYMSYKYVMKSMDEQDSETVISIAPGEEIEVEIPMGSGTASIANILKEKGIIRYPYIFKLVSKINGYDGKYKSGVHVLSKGLNYTQIMKILSNNPKSPPTVWVTIPEGLTYNQIVDILVEKKLVDRDKFNEIANNGDFGYDFIKKIPKRENRLEGYLFPDTYEFDARGGEKHVIEKMLNRFNKVFTEEDVKRAKDLNMSIDDIIILASIVEREAKVAEERPLIAGVFLNRLKSKDKTLNKLQSCATIQYIFLKQQGVVKEKILDEDTKIDDPYNTYIHEGLPPGPISSPGEASIKAVLYPEGDYLFFVLKEDGTGAHYFSKTYKEHLNAINKARKN